MKKNSLTYPRASSADHFDAVSAAERIGALTQGEAVQALKAAEDRGYSVGFKAGLEAARDASCEQCSRSIPLKRRWPTAANVHEKSVRFHGLLNCNCPDAILGLLEELS